MSERRRGYPLWSQLRNARLLGGLWTLGVVVLVAAGLQTQTSLEQLFLDPAFLVGEPWYTGVLSHVAVFAWTVAATAAGAGAWVARLTDRRTASLFLASGSMVTAVLLLDDLLQLRAAVLPATGMSAGFAAALVVAPAVVWVLSNLVEIGRTRWLLLAGALTGFAVSLIADAVGARLLIEDGAKLLGVAAWAQYFVVTTIDITRSAIRDARGIADRTWSVDDLGLRAAEGPQYDPERDHALDSLN